jgi:hypothetical protein
MLGNFWGRHFRASLSIILILVGARLILSVHKKRDSFRQIAIFPLRHSLIA